MKNILFLVLMLFSAPTFVFTLYQKPLLTLKKTEQWISNHSFLIFQEGKTLPLILIKKKEGFYLIDRQKQFGPFDSLISESHSSDSWGFAFVKNRQTILISSAFGVQKRLPVGKITWSANHRDWLILFQTNNQKFLKSSKQTLGPFTRISNLKFLSNSNHWIMKASDKNKTFYYYDGKKIIFENKPALLKGDGVETLILSPQWKEKALILKNEKEQFFIFKNFQFGPYDQISKVFLSDSGDFAFFYKKGFQIRLKTKTKTYGPYWNGSPNNIWLIHPNSFAWTLKNNKKNPVFRLLIQGKKIGLYKNLKNFEWKSPKYWKAEIHNQKYKAFLINGKKSENYFRIKWYGFSPNGKDYSYLGERKNGFYLIGSFHPDFGPFKKVSFFEYTSPQTWIASAQHFNTLWYLHDNKGNVFGPFDKIIDLQKGTKSWWAKVVHQNKERILIDGVEFETQGYQALSHKNAWFWLMQNKGTVYLIKTVAQ